MISPNLTIAPGAQSQLDAKIYLGPENIARLKNVAPNLDLTVDYGILWFISIGLFWLLKLIHHLVGNWGWSIVIVTCLIKLAFFHLSAKSYRSMAAMRQLQPRLQALKERHGDDRQKMTQATMELYKAEKINPLGGCLPIIVQIPVFIALYWVLLESVELRQAPFILWIQDLSVKDPYYILPIIMGFTMFIQQRLNPTPPDPVQAKVMMFLPLFFTFLFSSFPAGLVVYWIVNNSLSILQQWYIIEKMERK
jgi:YidC/Oxa1 family membrane protein insertase